MPAVAKKAASRVERLEARVTSEAKELCQQAAELQGRTLTDFVVTSAVNAAREVLREKEALHLTYQDRLAFIEALVGAPMEPNAKLRAAMAQHSTVAEN
jgi:uncharacterized protein (DUF1778 family)